MKLVIGFSDSADVSAATFDTGVRGRHGQARLTEGVTGLKFLFAWIEHDREPMFLNLKGAPWLPFFRKVPPSEGYPTGRMFVTVYPQNASLLSGEQISVM